MAKIYKLTKGSQTIYPATTTDAVVNPNTRKNLTAELAEIVNTTGKKLLQWVSFDAEKLIKPDGSISNMSNSNYCVATYQVTSNSQVRICLNLKYNINGSCVFVLKKDDTIVYTQLAGESKVFQYEIYTGECNTLLLQMNSQANTLAYISETPPIIGLVNDQVIEDGSITTPKLANNSVTAEKLDESLYNNLVFKGENVVYDEILSNSIIKKDGLLDTSSQYYKNYRLFKYSVAQGTQYSFSTTLKNGVTPGGFGIVSLFKGDTFVKHAVLSSSSLTYNGDIAVDVDCDLAYILSDKDLVPNLTKSSSAIIEDGSITTPKLANNSVTAEKLDESLYNNLVFKGENVVYDEILSNSIIKKDGLLDTSSQYYKNYRLFKYSVAQGTQYSFSTTLKNGVTPGGFGIVSLFKGDTFVKHAVLSSSSLTYNGDIAVDVDCDLAYILSDKDLVPNLTKSSSAIIEDGSITTPKLANNSVTAEKLDESITQEITNLIEFRKYQQGGYNVANTSGEYDRKMAETLYSIIQAQPTADIYVVDNYYGGYNNWSSPGRTYAQELKAMADWFSLGFISLKDAGIRERVDKEARVFTIDGLHAYTEIGAKRIYNRIMGQLLQRYNCDKSELTQKTFLLLGDSTSIIGEPTSWAKLLTEEFPGNVTVRAVAGTGWIDNNEGGGRNVLEQFNVDSVTQYDIIIITSGFNEYHHFQLDYASTIKYLSVYYNQLG